MGGNYFVTEPLNGTTLVDMITAKNVFCDSADLNVERLPEGFAFLNDSLRTKTEDGAPPLAHGLLPVLWLNALRPRPATTILRLTPLAGAPVQPACPECGCRLTADGQKMLRGISRSFHLQLNPEPVTQPPGAASLFWSASHALPSHPACRRYAPLRGKSVCGWLVFFPFLSTVQQSDAGCTPSVE